jgi:hypothetical protein
MNRREKFPIGFVIAASLIGITASEILTRKVEPKFVPGAGLVTTSEFAEKYKASRERAKSGDAEAATFIRSANRRLREIRDSVILHQAEDSQLFLQELARHGVTEGDYLK